MALRFEQKKAIVEEVNNAAKTAVSVVAADYRGLTSAQMAQLRAEARSNNVKLKVVRNTLARRAFSDTDYSPLSDSLTGPVLLAFSDNEPSASARLLRDFAKDHKKLEITALSLSGEVYDSTQVDVVANLPTKDEAIAKLMSVMQAPIVKFVRTLAEPKAKLVRVVKAVHDQKQAVA